MKNYIAVIDKDRKSSYGVVFPDVPGCYGAGETLDEAVENATEALRLYAEAAGRELDNPRSLEEIKENKEYMEGLENVTFAAIPLLADSGRTVRINITVDSGLLDAVDDAAKGRGLTRSAFIAQAAREKIQV